MALYKDYCDILSFAYLFKETIYLGHMASLYDIPEWKMLNPNMRADVIPVIENIRPGAKIELWRLKTRDEQESFLNQKQYLENWLQSSTLKYRDYQLKHYICKSESLLDKFWEGEIKEGEFLGYPLCCVTAFEEGCQRFLKGLGKGPMLEFGESARKAIQEGTYDSDLDYVLHVPCNVNCAESIEMAGKIKEALILRDKDAAEYLRKSVRYFIDPS